ncbi:PREDICTED: CBL-interacting serine/threonine-protein kinase 1-like [Nicotiana attenuata]|uniref:non-specific serine/threonine protein kinase n=1 Tax=Nicotiana attenuata TaxID=49451 RepID=A0A314KJQ2_NICAT|nr:PREDICTED: CBL-interacting serine/threonine-protein kinase 1-like [Nicotiana attenuata]OIT28929.1 cbl-interacting serinethreonine-protein kinase 1 [Nicotiana attenuata]
MVIVQQQEEEIRHGGGKKGMRLGKYEIGKTLGEGNFGKVKYAKHIESGQSFAIKILDKDRIIDLRSTDQIKREIGTLKLLKHPNVVRLYEVLASKSKIYMVLEYVNGGELFDRIVSKGKLKEAEGRKLFQQLIDGVSYCHEKGVFHRDLKLENILIDSKGNIKITDFGLSALPQHFRDDGLLHTTCGSPNYVAPEILSNRGYDGAASDTWSCGVILYVILTGYLPFDDRNLAVLYQKIVKGDVHIPKWLSAGAKNLIKRILDPNPHTRITMEEIKEDKWFKQDYTPVNPDEEDLEDDHASTDNQVLSVQEALLDAQRDPESPCVLNAFELIGMSSCLDLSGFFEKEDVSERKIRFTSSLSPKQLLERIENMVTQMGFHVQKKNGMLKVMQDHKSQKSTANLSVVAEVFEISPSLYVVELRKSSGDSTVYRQLCNRISSDLGVQRNQELIATDVY